MDLKAYLSRREEYRQDESFREVCLDCFRPKKSCFCDDIQAFDTVAHIVILMHPKEAKKVKMGTGRLTHLFLNNSEIRVGPDFTEDARVNALINDPRYFPVVLYPGENSVEISGNGSLIDDIKNRTLLVFVIDASWPLAKKILRQSKNLHALPQIHFRPQEPSQYVLKKQPHPYCLCTIESVILLLEELENIGLENCQGKQQVLREALDKMCKHQSEFINNAASSEFGKKKFLNVKTLGMPGKRQRRSVIFDDKNEP
ncbi:tRNA-uridine aminocarboxypropyltransferase [Acidobacteriota bacterium]